MRREYRSAISAVAFAALLVLAAVPQSAWGAMPAVCLFRNALGLECFGCGMTRALSSALHGDFSQAIATNAGVAVVLPVLVVAVASGFRR